MKKEFAKEFIQDQEITKESYGTDLDIAELLANLLFELINYSTETPVSFRLDFGTKIHDSDRQWNRKFLWPEKIWEYHIIWLFMFLTELEKIEETLKSSKCDVDRAKYAKFKEF